jgi:lysophospholipase L1-like esterase
MRVRDLAATAALAVASQAHAAAPTDGKWVEAWYAPPFPPTAVLAAGDMRVFAHQTVRQVVRLETGGGRLRVRLTNELGLSPVKIGAVHVALSSPNAVTEPETDHVLTFSGHPDVVIPVGQALVSDPVEMRVPAFADLAISVYFPERLAPSGHLLPVHVSPKGDHGAEPVWPEATPARAPALASGVEVEAGSSQKVVVAFGDSITEGAGATAGVNMDWPEQLALRLAHSHWSRGSGDGDVPSGDWSRGSGDGDVPSGDWVVINSGISGNRVLHPGAGPSALERFDRDVLDIPGVSAVILTEGINDIGWAFDPDGDTGPLTVADIVGAYKQLIARAHARGLRIFAGTLNPYEDAKYYHPEGEVVRAAVNDWIRHGGAFDGVIDFEQAVRDPQHPTRYRGADQSGDNLHPNDAGYRAMSEAVDLRLLQ